MTHRQRRPRTPGGVDGCGQAGSATGGAVADGRGRRRPVASRRARRQVAIRPRGGRWGGSITGHVKCGRGRASRALASLTVKDDFVALVAGPGSVLRIKRE